MRLRNSTKVLKIEMRWQEHPPLWVAEAIDEKGIRVWSWAASTKEQAEKQLISVLRKNASYMAQIGYNTYFWQHKWHISAGTKSRRKTKSRRRR